MNADYNPCKSNRHVLHFLTLGVICFKEFTWTVVQIISRVYIANLCCFQDKLAVIYKEKILSLERKSVNERKTIKIWERLAQGLISSKMLLHIERINIY